MYANEFTFNSESSIKEVIQLTQIQLNILRYLKAKDSYGAEIIGVIFTASGDNVWFSNGTIYPTLKKLENKEYISSYQIKKHPNLEKRRGKPITMYSITDKGKNALIFLDYFSEQIINYEFD